MARQADLELPPPRPLTAQCFETGKADDGSLQICRPRLCVLMGAPVYARLLSYMHLVQEHTVFLGYAWQKPGYGGS